MEMILILVIGSLVHIFLLRAVMDTYYRSIIELDLPLTNSTNNPAAKRVVLIVVDGLRARSVYKNNGSLTPFLTSIRMKLGSWGVSRGAPPTESRNGHTAIVAGLREDPKAIFNSWYYFPVRYDSVFERSRRSWVIAASTTLGKVFGRYATENVDIFVPPGPYFTGKMGMDQWSVEKLKSTLNISSEDQNGPRSIFAVLLPDMDAIGHFHPGNYSAGVRSVDGRVREIVRVVEQTFPDNLTAFLFTSDHGMFRSAHCFATEDEISSPLVVWGCGIRKHPVRQDVENIDLAPLISALLGIQFPTNSMGKLPLDYLDVPDSEKLQIFCRNLIQILNIFKAKQERLSKDMLLRRNFLDVDKVETVLSKFLAGSYENVESALSSCQIIYQELKIAIRKVHCSFTSDIIMLASAHILFWLLFLLLSLLSDDKDNSKDFSLVFSFFIVTFHVSLLILYSYLDLLTTFCLLPFGTLSLFLYKLNKTRDSFKLAYTLPPLRELIVFVLFVLSIMLGIHFHFLFVLTALLMAPIMNFQDTKEKKLRNIWIVLCLILSNFPLITPDIEWNMDGTNYYIIGSLIWHFLICSVFRNFLNFRKTIRLTKLQIVVSFLQLLFSIIVSFHSFLELDDHGWNMVLYASLIPILLVPFSMRLVEVRLVTIFLALATVYMVAAKSFGLIFLTFFVMLLLTWKILVTEKIESQCFVNFRNIWVMIGVTVLGFYGILQNDEVRIPTSEPTLYGVIVLVRLLMPVMCSCCIFRCIVAKKGVDLNFSFIVIELIFGTLALHLSHFLKNEGTWWDMGTSFQVFITINAIPLIIELSYFIASFLMNVGSSEVWTKLRLLLN
ncbi:GPI ethanolamine phosphate transferase 1-like [Harmonia axyridis]|uniref:GPI ethanolamine phosphate transferase 1-like n=1 Tax=Harmonia axyridis TaxID=115357 RepID=UPI001E277B85|nr:GPI ethanolamine phosphate transferase 1-like [Harmonia axyridis]